jgi:hypothetical protein
MEHLSRGQLHECVTRSLKWSPPDLLLLPSTLVLLPHATQFLTILTTPRRRSPPDRPRPLGSCTPGRVHVRRMSASPTRHRPPPVSGSSALAPVSSTPAGPGSGLLHSDARPKQQDPRAHRVAVTRGQRDMGDGGPLWLPTTGVQEERNSPAHRCRAG